MAFGTNGNIVLTKFPITEVNGGIRNLFRAFPKSEIILSLNDIEPGTITNDSGTILITTSGITTAVAVDEIFTIKEGLYKGRSGVITNIAALLNFEISVDINYIGDEITPITAFINRVDNDYKLQYRYIVSDTIDIQDNIPVLTDQNYTVFNNTEGVFNIDVNLMRDLLQPSFNVIDSDNDLMNRNYQVQIRELENGSILGSWETVEDITLSQFDQFIICHSTGFNPQYELNNKILDATEIKDTKIWRGYDKVINYIATSANQSLTNVTFRQREYTQDTQNIYDTTFTKDFGEGINYFTITINEDDARYLDISEVQNNSGLNLTVMDTLQDETEYYVTWISEEGSFRSWLFSAQNTDEIEFDKISIQETRFREIPTQATRTVTLTTRGLNLNDFLYIKSIIASNLMRVVNNGNTFECSVNNDSISYVNKSDTYDFEFELNIKPIETMRT